MEIQNVERAASPKVNCEAMGSNPSGPPQHLAAPVCYFLFYEQLSPFDSQKHSNPISPIWLLNQPVRLCPSLSDIFQFFPAELGRSNPRLGHQNIGFSPAFMRLADVHLLLFGNIMSHPESRVDRVSLVVSEVSVASSPQRVGGVGISELERGDASIT